VKPWLRDEGLSYRFNYAIDELATSRRLVPEVQGHEDYSAALRRLAARSNERLFTIVEQSSVAFAPA